MAIHILSRKKRNADDADFQTRIYADLTRFAVFLQYHCPTKKHPVVKNFNPRESALQSISVIRVPF